MKGGKDAIRAARALLKMTMAGGRIDSAKVMRVVKRYASEKPRGYLGILEAFQRLVRLETEKRQAQVDSAADLGALLRSQVERDLKAKYGADLTTEFRIDESLLGGMRVRVGSDVWDGSVRGRLARLADKLS